MIIFAHIICIKNVSLHAKSKHNNSDKHSLHISTNQQWHNQIPPCVYQILVFGLKLIGVEVGGWKGQGWELEGLGMKVEGSGLKVRKVRFEG